MNKKKTKRNRSLEYVHTRTNTLTPHIYTAHTRVHTNGHATETREQRQTLYTREATRFHEIQI